MVRSAPPGDAGTKRYSRRAAPVSLMLREAKSQIMILFNIIFANLSNPRQNTRETQTLKVVLGHPRLQCRTEDTEWSRSLRGPSSARAMAEELFASQSAASFDVGG